MITIIMGSRFEFELYSKIYVIMYSVSHTLWNCQLQNDIYLSSKDHKYNGFPCAIFESTPIMELPLCCYSGHRSALGLNHEVVVLKCLDSDHSRSRLLC